MVLFCKLTTRRTWKQVLSYYGMVWPTRFGTGGSYGTLAVNFISAEQDLGLSPEIAEVSIDVGTVLKKTARSCRRSSFRLSWRSFLGFLFRLPRSAFSYLELSSWVSRRPAFLGAQVAVENKSLIGAAIGAAIGDEA